MSDFQAPDLDALQHERYERCVALAEKHGVRLHRIGAMGGSIGVVRTDELAQEFASAGARVRSWSEVGSKVRAWDVEVREPAELV